MDKIERFTISPTENSRAGRSVIAQIVYEHILSMKSANRSEYVGLITETETLYNDVFSNISNRKQNLSKQVNLTKEVTEVKNEYFDLIDSLDAALVLKHKKNSKEQKQVFPNGISVFKRVNIDEIVTDMELMESHGVKFDAILGSSFAVDFNTVKLKYLSIFDQQKTTQTQVKSIIPDYKAKKILIDKQILKNICTIILANINEPGVLCTLINANLLNPPSKSKAKNNDKPYTLIILPGKQLTAGFTYTAKDTLLITNNSSISVFYYAAATANAPLAATLMEILPDEEVEIAANTLGLGNKFIIFVNKDTSIEAEVEIAFI